MMDLVAIWRRHHATDWAKAKKNIRGDEATLANSDINKVVDREERRLSIDRYAAPIGLPLACG
jgi:hypothetical protein